MCSHTTLSRAWGLLPLEVFRGRNMVSFTVKYGRLLFFYCDFLDSRPLSRLQRKFKGSFNRVFLSFTVLCNISLHMAPSIQLQRARAAIKAMKLLEFDEDMAKRVLKELLKVYGNNWEHIEAENYSLLVDAILDCQESKDPEPTQKDASISDDLMQPAKRLRHIEDPGSSQTTIEPVASGETLLRKRKFVAVESTLIKPRGELNKTAKAQCSYAGKGTSLSPDSFFKNGSAGFGEMAPHSVIDFEDPSPLLRCTKLSRHTMRAGYKKDDYLCDKVENVLCNEEPKIALDTEVLQETVVVNTSTIPDNLINITNKDISTNSNVPIAMEAPIWIPQEIADEAGEVGCSGANASHGLTHASSTQSAPNKGNGTESFQVPAQHEIANVQNTVTTNVKIASSKMGEEDVSKLSLLKESLNSSESAGIHHRLTRRSFNGSPSLGSREARRSANFLKSSLAVNGDSNGTHENCAQNILPLHENAVIASSPRNDEHDIAKGEERLTISVINEFNIEIKPPYFRYIPQNAIYQNAHVNFSLAQIGEDDCCINCFGNCLSASVPCPCTRETGGEFVYTTDGLLKKEFLNECISSMNCYTNKRLVYCKNCPLRSFNGEDKLVACKGHLVRKFIKECWSKCGCNNQCGNRVVQRGITRNLQVFYTADGKEWGLRTLEELPRGAFVCEVVGEILTIRELYDRTMQGYVSAKNIYTSVLDADWGSEEGLRDEEALCLDATFYGNVGRFINHRCFDANLIEVPVQWETPDHHYYHLAYFTTRKVEALEELTWDYGINFKDHAHPMKAFKCLCGSRVCRDSCRSS